jgi:hypothetical protein
MRDNNRLITVVIVAVLLIGAAFAFVILGRGEQPNVASTPKPEEQIAAAATAIPAIEIQEETEPTQAEVEEAQVAPTPRAGLEATDPETVNLASGDIQLVEVFAFW